MKNFLLPTITLIGLAFLTIFYAPSLSGAHNGPDEFYQLQYSIERSAVPALSYNDLTLHLSIGSAQPFLVYGNNVSIPFEFDSQTRVLRFNTSANTIRIVLKDVVNENDIGTLEKAVLLNDKAFAWSLGMDDNRFIKNQIGVMESYGWRGTLYLITNDLLDSRDEDWIVDPPYLTEKLNAGWSLGNHTTNHNCSPPIDEQEVIDGFNRIKAIVDASNKPSYKIISFSAPCFVSEYHPIILDLRQRGVTDVLFNESASRIPVVVDPNATDNVVIDTADVTAIAQPFDLDEPLGRGLYLELAQPETLIALFDQMAARFNQNGDHLWHNTIIHGQKEAILSTAADYLYNTYGAAGSDQVWVAPADEIVSYMLVRDNTTITYNESTEIETPDLLNVFLPRTTR